MTRYFDCSARKIFRGGNRSYLTAAEKAEVVRRYQAGESIYQIEALLKIPKTTVGRTLHRAGVELRKR